MHEPFGQVFLGPASIFLDTSIRLWECNPYGVLQCLESTFLVMHQVRMSICWRNGVTEWWRCFFRIPTTLLWYGNHHLTLTEAYAPMGERWANRAAVSSTKMVSSKRFPHSQRWVEVKRPYRCMRGASSGWQVYESLGPLASPS